MQTYRDFKPSGFDTAGLALDERQDWLVVPCTRNRDSGCLDESNFAVAMRDLGEGADVEVHRFGHWACGWFEIIIVQPDTIAAIIARGIEERLANYPVLDGDDFTEREEEAARTVWRDCYDAHGRIRYIRRHRGCFSFGSFRELMGCVRGKYFAGNAGELVG